MSRLDAIKDRLAQGLQPSPYGDTLGMRFQADAVQRGRTVVLLDVDERLHNPNGVLHGGALASLADSAMGSCMFTVLDDDETCTNLDLSVKYLRPTRTGTLRAESAVVKEGRTTCLVEARITDAEGRLVARAESTFLRMPLAAFEPRD